MSGRCRSGNFPGRPGVHPCRPAITLVDPPGHQAPARAGAFFWFLGRTRGIAQMLPEEFPAFGPTSRSGARGSLSARSGHPCPDSRAKHPCFACRDPRTPERDLSILMLRCFRVRGHRGRKGGDESRRLKDPGLPNRRNIRQGGQPARPTIATAHFPSFREPATTDADAPGCEIREEARAAGDRRGTFAPGGVRSRRTWNMHAAASHATRETLHARRIQTPQEPRRNTRRPLRGESCRYFFFGR